MYTSIPDVRWDVARRLHQRISRSRPGSESAEIAEHALDLIANPHRSVDSLDFADRDVWRNAQFSVRRSRARYLHMVDQLPRRAECGADGIVRETPEQVLMAADAESRLRAAIGSYGDSALHCLDSMLAGDTVEETAMRWGISSRTVNRARQIIRNIALPILQPAEV